jgi:triosephosphate isomerase (TIM)
MRKKIVAGNWKMNNTLEEGKALATEVVKRAQSEVKNDVVMVLATPFIHLTEVASILKGSKNVFLGAQNCSDHASGAYTGEVSASMLKSVGVQYVILGHSERREYFHETNEWLAKKLNIVLANGLTPIFCCGEPLEIRENETYVSYVQKQLTESLFHLSKEDFLKIVIAYEPIWAIGTGRNATSAQAQEMHAEIRNHLAQKYGQEAANEVSILYGGSCKPSNAKELFEGADVDGGLIGGASLKADDFLGIVNAF